MAVRWDMVVRWVDFEFFILAGFIKPILSPYSVLFIYFRLLINKNEAIRAESRSGDRADKEVTWVMTSSTQYLGFCELQKIPPLKVNIWICLYSS